MTNVMESMEDYVEYNDTIEPDNSTTNILAGIFLCTVVAAAFLFGRWSLPQRMILPTIFIHLTHDPKITSLYIDGHLITTVPSQQLGDSWTAEDHYDLNSEKEND